MLLLTKSSLSVRCVAVGAALLPTLSCSPLADAPGSEPEFPVHRQTTILLADERPFIARLSGSVNWVRCDAIDSVASLPEFACTGHRLPASRAAQIAKLVRALDTRAGAQSGDALWSAAVLDLMAGPSARRVDAIIDQLSVLADRHRHNANIRNDLAVAYLVRHAFRNDALSLLIALNEIERAHEADSASNVVAFNRALIFERLHLFDQAETGWSAMLVRDSASGWKREGKRQLGMLRAARARKRFATAGGEWTAQVRSDPQGAREYSLDGALARWAAAEGRGDEEAARATADTIVDIGEAIADLSADSSVLHVGQLLERRRGVLATGVLTFVDGARAFRQGRYMAALSKLDTSARELRAAGATALADWAQIPQAGVHIFRAQYSAADPVYVAIQRRARARGDVALEARAYWGLALSAARQGRTAESLSGYVRAGELFRQIGERTNQGSMLSQSADVLFLLGRDDAALNARVSALDALDARRDPANRGGPLLAFGRQLGEIGLTYAGLAMLREAVLSSNSSSRTSDRAEALLRLVSAEFAGGSAVRGRALLPIARDAALGVRDPIMHDRLRMELSQAEAAMMGDSDPAFAARRLDDVAGYFRQRRILFSLAAPLTQAARLRLRVADSAEAIRNLDEVVATLESQTINVEDAASVRAASAARREAYNELVSLRIAHHDTTGAFLLAEQGRGNRLARVPRTKPGQAFLSFSVLRDHTVVWIGSGDSVRMVRIAASSLELGELARRFETLTRSNRDSASWKIASHRLYELLIAPAERELHGAREMIVVADGPLARIPFAGLRSAGGRFLVEQVTVSHASAIRVRQDVAVATGKVVIVGNPAFDDRLFPELGRLSGADREVTAVRSAYPRAVTLAGAAATKPALSAALREADILHFAGHARLVERAPLLSHLVLARDGASVEDNSLSAIEIERFDFRRLHLVILSACGTTQALTRRDGKENGLAVAFLNAGAGSVISSLWEADDDGTAVLMEKLHHRLASGEAPPLALRNAQLDMIRSPSSFRSPRFWSAFQIQQ